MWLAAFWLFWCVVSTIVGQQRGRATLGFLMGFLLGPIGLLVVAMATDARRKCQACKGPVPNDASVCMHCGRELVAPAPREARPNPLSEEEQALVRLKQARQNKIVVALLLSIGLGATIYGLWSEGLLG